MTRTTYLLLEIGDDVLPVLLLLQASEGHLGTRDILRNRHEHQHRNKHNTNIAAHLFGVFEVLEKSVLVPCDTLVDVGRGVREALCLSGLAAEQTVEQGKRKCQSFCPAKYGEMWHFGVNSPVKVWADLVRTACLEGMALRAARLEERSTLASVTCRKKEKKHQHQKPSPTESG